MNIVEKIISEHLVSGEMVAGREIGIRIDQTLTQDATGTMAFLQFEAMGVDRVRNELALSYVDHNTIQVGPENADDHAFLRSMAARYGAVFSMPGNGICHQLHLERFGVPGKTLLGADSHTPTCGGLGMLAMGAGGLDVAVAMAGGPFFLSMPKVIKIDLSGRLRPWVSAKDVILKVLEMFSTKGNVGTVFEFGGSGVKNLEVPERATITNMGAECGVTSSVFPSDEVTRHFLELQGRVNEWRELLPDKGSRYSKVVKLNMDELEPLAAAPHSPGNIEPVSRLAGVRVDQVLVGSCTNSSYRDLRMVARLLEGRRVAPGVSFGVAPGSRQVLKMLAKDGSLQTLLSAGARILENACGFCIGNSMSPGTNAVSLRTSNRNFEGRSGTPSARVYLVSPEVATIAAIHGRVVDPLTAFDMAYPRVVQPKTLEIDDSMFVFPSDWKRKNGAGSGDVVRAEEESVVVRGPNIGSVPSGSNLPASIQAVVTIKVGDKITTDHIMPAGQRLKYRSNVEKYSQYVFEGVDSGFAGRAVANRDAGVANVIVAGESYGQGSSREHAALCPMFLGVKAVIARSIERIHCANLINFGILPLVFAKRADYDSVEQGDKLVLLDIRAAVSDGKNPVVRNVTKGKDMQVSLDLSERQREIILAGGLLNKGMK